MKNRPFGLDIGGQTIKAVWLSEENGSFRLKAFAQSPTPQKGMLSDSPFDQEEMAMSIRKMVKDAKITTPFVNFALPDSQVYTRVIEVPVLSEKELSLAIYWEAEQYIPLPLANVTIDWSILRKPTPESGEKMQVLLVGAPTILLDKYQKILTMADLSINSVEPEILATIRPLTIGKQYPTSLIVSIGDLNTSFAIIKDGQIVFTYSIAAGGIALTRAVASDFGFTITQAEDYKNTYGVLHNALGAKIGKSTEPILMSIITEIKKAVAFYLEKYKDDHMPIQQIVISGAEAKLPGIDLFFAKNCGIETVIANPLRQLGLEESVPKQALEQASKYAIVIGLAMRDYE